VPATESGCGDRVFRAARGSGAWPPRSRSIRGHYLVFLFFDVHQHMSKAMARKPPPPRRRPGHTVDIEQLATSPPSPAVGGVVVGDQHVDLVPARVRTSGSLSVAGVVGGRTAAPVPGLARGRGRRLTAGSLCPDLLAPAGAGSAPALPPACAIPRLMPGCRRLSSLRRRRRLPADLRHRPRLEHDRPRRSQAA